MTDSLSTPLPSFADAVAQVEELQGQDDDTIHADSRTRSWLHGRRTERAILYLQGYTDSTRQFAPLGDLLFERGYNVFAPRMPYHGYKDRMTGDHCRFTAPEMLEWTKRVTDIAVGLGDTLTVIGLSLGGVLATWVAEERADVGRVLIVAPAYGSSLIPAPITTATARVARRLPNFFIWWDPRVREQAGFEYTYPRFATHTLAQAFLLGSELLSKAREKPPAAPAVWMITNANDLAVSNQICRAFVTAWKAHGGNRVHTFEFPKEHGIPHDLMDANDPAVKPEIVYPALIEIIQQELKNA